MKPFGKKTAMNLAELHSTKIDGIDQSGADTDMSLDIISESENFRVRTRAPQDVDVLAVLDF